MRRSFAGVLAAFLASVPLAWHAGAQDRTATTSPAADPPGGAAMTGEGTPIVVTATDAGYARVVSQAASAYMEPAFAALAASATRLSEVVAKSCAGGSRDDLAAAFGDVLDAWAAVDFLRFGPMQEAGRADRFSYFPDVHGTGARQLRRFLSAHDEALLAPGALARQSAAVQGLPALEQLLYGGSDALLTGDGGDPFRCRLAAAVAANLAAIARDALAAWSAPNGWAALMTAPGPANPVYRSHEEAMTEVLKAILTGLEQLRDQRILAALGKGPDDGKASRAPFARSGHALASLQAGAAAVKRLIDASGFLALLPAAQASYADSLQFEFGNLDAALAAAAPDLADALAEPQRRAKLAYAAIVLASLRDTIQNHVAVFTGLSAGFNSMDGD